MEITIKKGNQSELVILPDENVSEVLLPNEVGESPDSGTEKNLVKYALENPINSARLKDIVRPGEKIAIITSDISRPMPTYKVMPALLDELYLAGVNPNDITLVFALGIHRGHTKDEMLHLAGERAFNEIRCVDSNRDDLVNMGVTDSGTPIDITRIVAEADRRICLGNIEFHYFAGYSGGAKAIMPGVSGHDAIQNNHSQMVREEACAGRIEGNPVRSDIEAAAAIVGVDFILNVILNAQKQIVCAVAGDVTQAHRKGCEFLDKIYKKPIKERADIVIVSQGGAPKDMNLYQTQKALDNSKHAIKDGGIVILVGSCLEGFGERTFEEWFMEAEKPEDLIERLHKTFRLGGHKAAAIALVMRHAKIFLVSDLPDETVKKIFMTPFHSVQEAFDEAFRELGNKSKIIVMPYGGSTLPQNKE